MYWGDIRRQAEEIYKTHGDDDNGAYKEAREWAKYCSWNVSNTARGHVIQCHGINFSAHSPQGKNLAYAAICRDLETAYEAVKLEISMAAFMIEIGSHENARKASQSDIDPFVDEADDLLLTFLGKQAAEDAANKIRESYKKSGFNPPEMKIVGMTKAGNYVVFKK